MCCYVEVYFVVQLDEKVKYTVISWFHANYLRFVAFSYNKIVTKQKQNALHYDLKNITDYTSTPNEINDVYWYVVFKVQDKRLAPGAPNVVGDD